MQHLTSLFLLLWLFLFMLFLSLNMLLNKQLETMHFTLPHLCSTNDCWFSVTWWVCWKYPYLLHMLAVPHASQVDVPLCHSVGVPVSHLSTFRKNVSWTSRFCCVMFFQVDVLSTQTERQWGWLWKWKHAWHLYLIYNFCSSPLTLLNIMLSD